MLIIKRWNVFLDINFAMTEARIVSVTKATHLVFPPSAQASFVILEFELFMLFFVFFLTVFLLSLIQTQSPDS